MSIIKRVFTDVTDSVFYGTLNRARADGQFIQEDNKINLSKLFETVIRAFASGNYTILPITKKEGIKKPQYRQLDNKRIYTDISEQLFGDMIERAKKENIFVTDKKVDIGALLHMLLGLYSTNELVLKKKKVETHTERFDYRKGIN